MEQISMAEILTRHEVRKRQADGELLASKLSTTVGLFQVKPSNSYLLSEGTSLEADNEEESKYRTVQIKILDVLFNDRVCSLIYMHDTTNLIKWDQVSKHKLDTRAAQISTIKLALEDPGKLHSALKDFVFNQTGNSLSVLVNEAIQTVILAIHELQHSIRDEKNSLV